MKKNMLNIFGERKVGKKEKKQLKANLYDFTKKMETEKLQKNYPLSCG